MYNDYDTPRFWTGIFYYDNDYSMETILQIRDVLKKHGFYPPGLIHAGKRTNNRYVKFNEHRDTAFLDAYCEDGVASLGISGAEHKKATSFWDILLTMAYYKNSSKHMLKDPSWNVLRFSFTYDKWHEPDFFERYLLCVKELIVLLKAFHAKMEDMDVSTSLHLVRSGLRSWEAGVQPTEYGVVKAIYWGNYFSLAYCEKYQLKQHLSDKDAVWEPLGDGIFFTLTKDLDELCTKACLRKRKRLTKKLGIQSIHPEAVASLKQIAGFLKQKI